jgi:hypothetical protein
VPKESRNFRLDSEVLKMLREISEEWHVSQAQVIEMLVREAVAENKQLKVVREKKGASCASS